MLTAMLFCAVAAFKMSNFLATICVKVADFFIYTGIIASKYEHPDVITRVFDCHYGGNLVLFYTR